MIGIPEFKLLSNGPWLVSSAEIRQALGSYQASAPGLQAELEADDLWRSWIEWLREDRRSRRIYCELTSGSPVSLGWRPGTGSPGTHPPHSLHREDDHDVTACQPAHAATRIRMSQISWRTTVARQSTEDTPPTRIPVTISCTVSRRPDRAARAADSDGAAGLPLRSRPAGLWRRSAGAKGEDTGPQNPGSHGAAADLTRGPLAAAPSGLCGRPGRRPDRGQAYSRRPRVKSAAPPFATGRLPR